MIQIQQQLQLQRCYDSDHKILAEVSLITAYVILFISTYFSSMYTVLNIIHTFNL